MHTSGHQYILFYFLFQIMVNKKHGKQNRKKCGIYKRHFSLRTIKLCRFEIIDGVKYVYCIKHAYKFLLREQLGFAAVLWRLRQCVSCCSLFRCRIFLSRAHRGITITVKGLSKVLCAAPLKPLNRKRLYFLAPAVKRVLFFQVSFGKNPDQ